MASVDKSKKSRTKAPKGRPAATSALSQPAVQDASSLTALSVFSPKGNLFAFLSFAVDKHRLRVYDTTSGHSIAEHVSDATVTFLVWSSFDPSQGTQPKEDDSPNKKKRKKRNSVSAADAETPAQGIEVVLLGRSDGSLVFFSPSHGRVLRTLSHSSSTSAILSAVSTVDTDGASPTIWTSSADGTVRLWNSHKNGVTGSWKNDDRMPYSSMAARPGSSDQEDGRIDLLLANHGIRLLSTSQGITFETSTKPKELATFTGHASSINHLQWDASQKPATRFLTMADGDRVVYVWQVPSVQGTEGKIIASIPLDSDARAIALSSTSPSEKQTLLTLSASGKISVYPIPPEISAPASTGKTQHKVSTLLSRSNISITSKKNVSVVQVVSAAFVHGEVGKIRVARVIGGVRPVFGFVEYQDASGDFIQDVNIVQDDSGAGLAVQEEITAPNKRYAESSSLAVRSGIELGEDAEMDDLAGKVVDGDLNVDLAELSLGQRLTAISSLDATASASEESSDEDGVAQTPRKSKRDRKAAAGDGTVVPANSLTRTLIQALHSSDARLLETCLAHSDLQLIRNTIRRLPPQLAVPLLTACVERLGRGGRGGSMKGGGGGASSQRGAALIGWVKAVLAVHSGHLMTMPDLVARLSGLHATLTSRLTLQDSLLSLSGRLDMVLSQIEIRSSVAPPTLAPQKSGKKGSKNAVAATSGGKEARRYVEGESSDDDEMDVEVEVGSDDDGSVEDVELGGDSDEDEDEDDESEGDEDDSDEDGDGPRVNGFIDDEADEDDDEDDDSE